MKNPIAVALGNALREIRNHNGIPVEELVDGIGINSSYYRLLESGTNTIHISKTIDVINSFNKYGASLSYEGFYKLLMGVYFTQPLVKLSEDQDKTFEQEKNKLLIYLEDYDKKLFVLIKEFDRLSLFEKTEINSKDVVEILQNEKTTDLVLFFLNDYSDFGETNLNIQNSSIAHKLRKLPTFYFEFIQDTIDNLFYLPTIMGNLTLWEWEEKNKAYFTDMICLTNNAKSVVSQENLSRYKYSYLWQRDFKQVKMIIIDNNQKASALEQNFRSLLKESLSKDNSKEELKSFDDAVNKMTFGVINETFNPGLITELLTGKPLNTKASRLESELYDAIWIFTIRKDKDVIWNVAFLADINYEEGDEKYLLENVVSLNYEDLEIKFEQLNEIWEQSSKN